MKIKNVERLLLHLPFSPLAERHMHRASTHGEEVTLCRVTLDNGVVGYGETWDAHIPLDALVGKNALEVLREPSVGMGVQIALYDAIGRTEGIPVYRLIGAKVRDWCPISWWAIDMPPEDWVANAKEAVRLGYTSFKLKARPWRDIVAQVAAISEVVPPHFKLDVDFNRFLLNAGNALPVLRKVQENPNVAIFESPIPQDDVEGHRQLRGQIDRPISLHFGVPPILTVLREDVCDGFVIGGDTETVMRQGMLAAEANKPFWLQMVGSGIMTAFTVHLGAVLSHAQWPAITCHDLWMDDLLMERLDVQDGYIRVPEGPGLGVEVDEEAIERYRVEPGTPSPKQQYLAQRRVLRIRWPGDRTWCFTNEAAYQESFYDGNMPLFEPGVDLEVIEDNESESFERLYDRVARGDGKGA